MADVRIEINQAGFKELALSDGIRAACLAEAERGRVIAEGLAADITKTGRYLESFNTFTAVTDVGGAGGVHKAVSGVLKNDSDHAAAVEWGNQRNGHTAHHILGRTLGFLEHG